eukprot:403331956
MQQPIISNQNQLHQPPIQHVNRQSYFTYLAKHATAVKPLSTITRGKDHIKGSSQVLNNPIVRQVCSPKKENTQQIAMKMRQFSNQSKRSRSSLNNFTQQNTQKTQFTQIQEEQNQVALQEQSKCKDQGIQVDNYFEEDLIKTTDSQQQLQVEDDNYDLQNDQQHQKYLNNLNQQWEAFQVKKHEQFKLFEEFYQEAQCDSYEIPQLPPLSINQQNRPINSSGIVRVIRLQDLQINESENHLQQSFKFNNQSSQGNFLQRVNQSGVPYYPDQQKQQKLKIDVCSPISYQYTQNVIDLNQTSNLKSSHCQLSAVVSPLKHQMLSNSKHNETVYFSLRKENLESTQKFRSINIVTPLKDVEGNIQLTNQNLIQHQNNQQYNQLEQLDRQQNNDQLLQDQTREKQVSPFQEEKSTQQQNSSILYEKVQIKPIIRNSTINKLRSIEETGTFSKEQLFISNFLGDTNQLQQLTTENNDKEAIQNLEFSRSSQLILQLPLQEQFLPNDTIKGQEQQNLNESVNKFNKSPLNNDMVQSTTTLSPSAQSSENFRVQQHYDMMQRSQSQSPVASTYSGKKQTTVINRDSFKRAKQFVENSEEKHAYLSNNARSGLSPQSHLILFKGQSMGNILKNGYILSSRRSSSQTTKGKHSKQASQYQSLFDRAALANGCNRNQAQNINSFQSQTYSQIANNLTEKFFMQQQPLRPQLKQKDYAEKLQDKLSLCLKKNAIRVNKIQAQPQQYTTQNQSCLNKARSKSIDVTKYGGKRQKLIQDQLKHNSQESQNQNQSMADRLRQIIILNKNCQAKQ